MTVLRTVTGGVRTSTAARHENADFPKQSKDSETKRKTQFAIPTSPPRASVWLDHRCQKLQDYSLTALRGGKKRLSLFQKCVLHLFPLKKCCAKCMWAISPVSFLISMLFFFLSSYIHSSFLSFLFSFLPLSPLFQGLHSTIIWKLREKCSIAKKL